MYLDFYGLSEKPFNTTPDPKFLYMSPGHREALAQLLSESLNPVSRGHSGSSFNNFLIEHERTDQTTVLIIEATRRISASMWGRGDHSAICAGAGGSGDRIAGA